MVSRRFPYVLLLLLMLAARLHAGAARPGWSKIELTGVGSNSAAAIADLLQPYEGEVIADYGAYTIAYVETSSLDALTEDASKANIRIRARDDLDVLQLPAASVDARIGISGIATNRLIQNYPSQKSGVFVLQLAAPARSEWIAELQSIGWTIARYVPNDGFLIVGTSDLVSQTRNLSYVQWLDFFHPYQKSATLAADQTSHPLLFELPGGAASEDAVAAITAAADGPVEVRRGYDTLVYASMTSAAADALMANGMILGVGPRPDGQLADARQVQSFTSLLNPAQTQPLPGQDYWSWVVSRCPDCASMPASAWKIGAADSGLDNGSTQFGHPDLNGRKYFGIMSVPVADNDTQCAPSQPLCDAYQHGTLVSGMAVGNGATAARDSGGYLMGLGGAPTAGIFMTKILSRNSGIDPSKLFDWTADAANHGVTVQNHSWENSSPTNAGKYTSLSRQFDIAARDSDNLTTAARIPLLLSVAAGNDYTQGAQNLKTSPVGTAKNVLTVGGLENYRPEADTADCWGTRADSYWNIMRISRNGTNLGSATKQYIKPDVVAPASLIVSTQTSIWWGTQSPIPYCLNAYEGDVRYSGASGTSFSAPLGSAASLIVKRYLGTAPENTSPALVRAVLVAGARSVRGGEDRSRNPAIPITAVPSQQQGFGRLTLEDILNGAQKPVVFDQSTARTFTSAGQTFCTRLRVRDNTKPVKVALVWTDAPGMENSTNPLVNDLNLEVRRTSVGGRVYVGNSLAVTANGEESVGHLAGSALPYDDANNVEYFRSFMNANEELNITVKAQNIAGDTDGNTATFEQDFALAILNADLVSVGTCDTPPTATFTVSCSFLTCTANGSASSDDFGIINYSYNWGDGTITNGGAATQSHTYAAAGTYSIVLTTTDTIQQSTTSAPQTVTACVSGPTITAQPTSRTINAGQSTTLSVTASLATGYQWFIGTSGDTSNPITGATSSSVTVTPATTTSYYVRVTNSCGRVDSATATVTVCQPPGISQQPQSPTIPSGSSTTLTVVASGSGPFTYQWYQGASSNTANPISGATNASYTTPALFANAQYWVKMTSGCNGTASVNSNTANVTVTCVSAPSITTQPVSQTINLGQSATLSVTASTSGTTTYQWFIGPSGNQSQPISGATGTSVTVTPSSTTSYWVRVSNGCGAANSATATVTVCVPPSITAQPQSTTIVIGNSATLTVTASGSAPISYQWYTGASPNASNPIAGATSASLTVSPTVTTSYWVRVTGSCNGTATVNSNTATVTVVPPGIMRRQQNFALANSQRSITATWPQATQTGNLLVAVISAEAIPSINNTITPPAGWLLAQGYEWNHVKNAIYYMPNNGGGRTSETFTIAVGFHDMTVVLLEYSGVALTSPLDRTAFDGDNFNNGTLASGTTFTTSQPKEVAITALTVYGNTSFSSPTNGFTELDDHSGGNFLTTAVHERLTTTAGALGHQATVGTTNVEWVGVIATFKSANPN
ncbi:MAG: hypothetical protein JOZ54_01220 [Acidobacteria bacterium]|nr:hypothetical protein [Acidobacteriota bacterium]